jgi:hypothetical protein
MVASFSPLKTGLPSMVKAQIFLFLKIHSQIGMNRGLSQPVLMARLGLNGHVMLRMQPMGIQAVLEFLL